MLSYVRQDIAPGGSTILLTSAFFFFFAMGTRALDKFINSSLLFNNVAIFEACRFLELLKIVIHSCVVGAEATVRS
jgi:hypothetical protein